MLERLKSLFSGQRNLSHEAVDAGGGIIETIVGGLRRLETVGLAPSVNVGEDGESLSVEAARAVACTVFVMPPTQMTWAMLALSHAKKQPFSNAISLKHRLRGGDRLSELTAVLRDVAALAADEWRVEAIDIVAPEGAGGRVGEMLEVRVEASPPVEPFFLEAAQSFDWSFVSQFNERLPSGVKGRFAADADVIVFLAPLQIDELNALSGWDFSTTPGLGAKVVTQ